MIEIRKLTVEDAAAYRELRLAALRDFPESFGSTLEVEEGRTLEDVRARLVAKDTERDFIAAAYQGERAVGMIGLLQIDRHKMSHKAMIWGMYVRPECQGEGVGFKLMEYALAEARKIDELEQVNLTVVSSNERARRLYRKVGFETYGAEKRALRVDGVYYDEEMMVLFL